MTKKFPTTISDEDNYDLMSPVTLKEIQSVLAMSKNDKSLGPDGIPIEVYRLLFEVLGMDLLHVIEDS